MDDVAGEGLIQGWISSKGAHVEQEPLEKTQQSCLLVGEGGEILLTTRCSFLHRKVMTAEMREGEKNAGQHRVWDEVSPLPATASSHSGPSKRVTGSSQPPLWGGLSRGNFHLSTFRVGSRDGKAPALPLEGWADKAERSREGNGSISQLPLLLGHGWASSRATRVGCYCSSLVQLSYCLYRASVPPALNGFLVSLIPSSSGFLAHST